MEEVASGIGKDDAGRGTGGGGEAGREGVVGARRRRAAEDLVDGDEGGDEEKGRC